MPYGQRQGKYGRAASPAFGQEEKDEEESKVYICAGWEKWSQMLIWKKS